MTSVFNVLASLCITSYSTIHPSAVAAARLDFQFHFRVTGSVASDSFMIGRCTRQAPRTIERPERVPAIMVVLP